MKQQAIRFFYVLLAISIFTHCEEVDNFESEEAGNVQGFWELEQTTGSNTFLKVSETEFTFYYYDAAKPCITIDSFKVVDIEDGGFYVVTKDLASDERKTFALSKNGERVHVRDIEETQKEIQRFWSSQVDIENLAPVCYDNGLTGVWELDSEDEIEYADINEQRIKVATFFEPEGCFDLEDHLIVSVDGSVFTFEEEGPDGQPEQYTADISRVDSTVTVMLEDDGEEVVRIFKPAKVELGGLNPYCSNE